MDAGERLPKRIQRLIVRDPDGLNIVAVEVDIRRAPPEWKENSLVSLARACVAKTKKVQELTLDLEEQIEGGSWQSLTSDQQRNVLWTTFHDHFEKEVVRIYTYCNQEACGLLGVPVQSKEG